VVDYSETMHQIALAVMRLPAPTDQVDAHWCEWSRRICLEAVAYAAARYVASHRCQAVRIQDATDAVEYDAASKALDAALRALSESGKP